MTRLWWGGLVVLGCGGVDGDVDETSSMGRDAAVAWEAVPEAGAFRIDASGPCPEGIHPDEPCAPGGLECDHSLACSSYGLVMKELWRCSGGYWEYVSSTGCVGDSPCMELFYHYQGCGFSSSAAVDECQAGALDDCALECELQAACDELGVDAPDAGLHGGLAECLQGCS